ncbi:hydrogenase expression/formation protein HypE [Candidatus Haliotispira prima]|uniref:Hydrogenase expression/formation protein HypE n=1 Tax=Candidatus Haliotispira prima TaxID=3034016 RepID=A0ABY8MJM5_9SPIO|nr:hydrogenase expression/formation protein HypE [Candidatus Haliotispira prima]
MTQEIITLAHGSGGHAMQQLIEQEIMAVFANPLAPANQATEDQARVPLSLLQAHSNGMGGQLAMTTDSFVIDPIFFPGGDIGSLAVNGTVNDLAVGGAKPLYLSCGLILEEGLPISDLRKILQSMRRAADDAGVAIITGDTKVVNKGCADKIFINTCGVGVIPSNIQLSVKNIRVGDVLLINGSLGDHGATIMAMRGDLGIDKGAIRSDCNGLNEQIQALLEACPGIRCMRDATRGGIAAILNEFAQSGKVKIQLKEDSLPLKAEVRGLCELLGLDPLYLANEGKFVAILPEAEAQAGLTALQSFSEAKNAAIIGRVLEPETSMAPVLTMRNAFGSERLIDVPYGEQLPRIC